MPAASPAPSPSYSSFSSPSPRNPDLSPNPHPYAIKTTSTALLSRSNSSGFNTNAARNHYVPLSPSPTRTRSSTGKHRSSKSQYVPEASPTKAPRPLPTPPPFPSTAPEGPVDSQDIHKTRRSRRADTLPSAPAPFNPLPAIPSSIVDLPSNPKLWTPSELSSYLATALRVTSQSKAPNSMEVVLPARVAKDVAGFVREMRITGRTFLRLNDNDLTVMGVNKKWREALLLASRNLRQNVLKGRIWGPDLDPDLEDIISPPSSQAGSTSSSPSRPLPNPPIYSNHTYSSSSESLDSVDADPSGPEGRPRRHRNGRVRGMVATFERSGSFSSDAGSLDEGKPGVDLVAHWRNEAMQNGDDDDALSISSRSSPEPGDTTFTAESTAADIDDSFVKDSAAVEEEPSIEELLTSAELSGDPRRNSWNPKRASWGARAWEEMELSQGITVKRLPTDEVVNGGDTIVANGSRNGSGKSSGRGTRGRGREDRRIVTAIFAPSAASQEPQLPVLEHVAAESEPVRPLPPVPASQPSVDEHYTGPRDTQSAAEVYTPNERVLMAELADTRALLEVFRTRLETVEQRMSALEERELPIPSDAAPHVPVALAADGCTRCQDKSVEFEPQSYDADVPEPTLGSVILSSASSLLPPFMTSATSSSSAVARRSRNSVRHSAGDVDTPEGREHEPASVSDIPSYVLLVGIGVCAVVLRVVLKRVGGRRG
ncbi:hypothetical protein EIP91_008572 [Steccherinum ochraceum]|uniref:SAM domain-containing protein n=1 Tax=Steccherinum ochraceum TaxID=92696 RepID=A0A4R0R8A1_9APHY|nr:hypothetical protein EIP91_008572 [Steccherinum ochraceum]